MEKSVEFESDGLNCRGWLHRPDGPVRRRPVVVYCYGMGEVHGGTGTRFAKLFAERGFCAFEFDYRFSGASEGSPRGRVIPSLQHDDIRAAIGFVLEQDGVDENKLILEGASYGGAHALFVGALDPRVKGVITLVSGMGPRHMMANQKAWNATWKRLTNEFMTGDRDSLFPMIAPAGEPCLLPQPDCYEWLMKNASPLPNWLNGITLESRLRAMEYVPTAFIDAISPRPLLMFAAEHDSLLPPSVQRAAFDSAREPKRFELLECGHFDLYEPGPLRDRVMDIKMEWLASHGLAP